MGLEISTCSSPMRGPAPAPHQMNALHRLFAMGLSFIYLLGYLDTRRNAWSHEWRQQYPRIRSRSNLHLPNAAFVSFVPGCGIFSRYPSRATVADTQSTSLVFLHRPLIPGHIQRQAQLENINTRLLYHKVVPVGRGPLVPECVLKHSQRNMA